MYFAPLNFSTSDSGGFLLVADKRSNVVIVSASQSDNTRTIEGYRPLDNCNDQSEDIYLEGKGV